MTNAWATIMFACCNLFWLKRLVKNHNIYCTSTCMYTYTASVAVLVHVHVYTPYIWALLGDPIFKKMTLR